MARTIPEEIQTLRQTARALAIVAEFIATHDDDPGTNVCLLRIARKTYCLDACGPSEIRCTVSSYLNRSPNRAQRMNVLNIRS